MQNIMHNLINKLGQYQNNTDLWKNLEWREGTNSQGDYIDENSLRRKELLIALQVNLPKARISKNFEQFLQFLLKQEIDDRGNDPFQGLTESLTRAGFLLARFRNPANVWLFVAAKTANFDTHCGFDWEYMLSAGIKETFDYVEAKEHPLKEQFYNYFNGRQNCPLSQPDIDKWFTIKQNTYPSSSEIAETDLSFWIDLAVELRWMKNVKQLLPEWIQNQRWDSSLLRKLKYYQNFIEDWNGQIQTLRELFIHEQNEYLKFYDYCELAELYLKLGNPFLAWQVVLKCKSVLPLDKDKLGELGVNALDIISYSQNEEWVKDVFSFVISHQPHYLSLDYLLKLVAACQQMNDKQAEERFIPLLEAEKQRYNEIMMKNNSMLGRASIGELDC
ncbi:hypothetical protein QNI16_02740 [Cytophagaceae bacterium YF14B1]|uniref:Uncharacterized protein n=1 Tax=Xanthocytophaga flava TaxID=3048013 RepID=A0AAE3U438_9BACT|nr:hypothetical protein [Xanthocytophaga flavus]MDJ1479384.1 hypothetical protein [Xanthocytophaga flavus]